MKEPDLRYHLGVHEARCRSAMGMSPPDPEACDYCGERERPECTYDGTWVEECPMAKELDQDDE